MFSTLSRLPDEISRFYVFFFFFFTSSFEWNSWSRSSGKQHFPLFPFTDPYESCRLASLMLTDATFMNFTLIPSSRIFLCASFTCLSRNLRKSCFEYFSFRVTSTSLQARSMNLQHCPPSGNFQSSVETNANTRYTHLYRNTVLLQLKIKKTKT